MQRYHTTGLSDGIVADSEDAYRSKGETTMFPATFGYWVLYADVVAWQKEHFAAGRCAGLSEGRQETAAKVEALQAIHETAIETAENAAYRRGFDDGCTMTKQQQPLVIGPIEHKDTRALINELYHDRARLERVVDDACNLAAACMKALIGGAPTNIEDEPVTNGEVAAWCGQFVDTHGGG